MMQMTIWIYKGDFDTNTNLLNFHSETNCESYFFKLLIMLKNIMVCCLFCQSLLLCLLSFFLSFFLLFFVFIKVNNLCNLIQRMYFTVSLAIPVFLLTRLIRSHISSI